MRPPAPGQVVRAGLQAAVLLLALAGGACALQLSAHRSEPLATHALPDAAPDIAGATALVDGGQAAGLDLTLRMPAGSAAVPARDLQVQLRDAERSRDLVLAAEPGPGAFTADVVRDADASTDRGVLTEGDVAVLHLDLGQAAFPLAPGSSFRVQVHGSALDLALPAALGPRHVLVLR
jgi:hypothetical protein